MGETLVASLALGVALAGAPGPVQAVLLGESIAGGTARGFRAMAGANLTWLALMLLLALGLSIATPRGVVLRALQISGGALLLWLAVDGFRSDEVGEPRRTGRRTGTTTSRRTLPPVVRGALAVLLNPGAWLFLGAVASPLFARASRIGGTGNAVLASLVLAAGVSMGDGAVVLFGGLGVRRAGDRVRRWVRRGLATVLAGVGVYLVVQGVR